MILCERCGGENVELGRQMMASGRTHICWFCHDCDRPAQLYGPYIPKANLENLGYASEEELPIVQDLRNTEYVCEYHGCDEIAVEVHHWGPKHLFDDFESWPKSYLCPVHHHNWHKVVTPKMWKRRYG